MSRARLNQRIRAILAASSSAKLSPEERDLFRLVTPPWRWDKR
jgi:hypothetical protein